ncbi:unknown [Prevotella sp. CAG:1058]|nr:unknown [Prevotella sp. CAG:1058]
MRIKRFQMGTSILTRVGLFHLSAVRGSNKLGTVTNAEDWVFAYKPAQINLESFRIMNRIR